MNEKMFNTRIIHKHDTEANWQKAENFIPKEAELIVYDPDENYTYSRLKIGDGITKVNNLPFHAGALASKDKVGKTDLEQSIQESLNKADSALQSAPVTSVNGQTGAIVLNTIPSYSTSNNDQFLKIVDGSPTWVTIQNAEEVNF